MSDSANATPSPSGVGQPQSVNAAQRTLNPGARSALAAAFGLGLVADLLLRHGPGLGLVLWIAALAGCLAFLLGSTGRAIGATAAGWMGVAILCAAGLAWRDSQLLLVVDFLAMLAALGFLAGHLAPMHPLVLATARVRDVVLGALEAGLAVAFGVLPLAAIDAELHTAVGPSARGNAWRVGRAVLLTLPVLLAFTILFSQADPVFGAYVRWPEIDLEQVLPHVAVTGFFTWVVAGWFRRALLGRPVVTEPAVPRLLSLGSLDTMLMLGALNLLFAVFVLVQLGWLFGGEALVRRTTGLGYAEYARRGFAELTAVTVLLVTVLLGVRALADEATRTVLWFRRLSIPLVVLLGAVMVSAFGRMNLYVLYYGISTDRLFATAFMAWLAVVVVWLAMTVLRERPRHFVAGAVVSGYVVLFALNALNPDALVARRNLARASMTEPGRAGADPAYVASLGGDAVPPLLESLLQGGTDRGPAWCQARDSLLKEWAGDSARRRRGHWTQWNLGHRGAHELVAKEQAALQRLVCRDSS